jgi:hypothetical protein
MDLRQRRTRLALPKKADSEELIPALRLSINTRPELMASEGALQSSDKFTSL